MHLMTLSLPSTDYLSFSSLYHHIMNHFFAANWKSLKLLFCSFSCYMWHKREKGFTCDVRSRSTGCYKKIRQHQQSRKASHAAAKKINTFNPDCEKFFGLDCFNEKHLLCHKWLNSSRGRTNDTLCLISYLSKKQNKVLFYTVTR